MTVFHEYYPFDLSLASDEIKRQEFAKMLGTPEIVLVGVVGAGLPDLYDAVCRFNNAQARAVAGTQASEWAQLKVVVWRGSWCVRASFQCNKRRTSSGPPGPVGLAVAQLGLHQILVRLTRPPRVGILPSRGGLIALSAPGIVLSGPEFRTAQPFTPNTVGLSFEDTEGLIEQLRPKAEDEFARYMPRFIDASTLPPLDPPKAHPFGETYPTRRGGKAARKMQRQGRR